METVSTIAELFYNNYKKHSHYKYLTTIENNQLHPLNFHNIMEEVLSFSFAMQDLSLKKSTRISILSNTRIEWALTDLGCFFNGFVSVPIYPSNTAEEILFTLEHSKSSVIFIENDEQFKKIISIQDKLTTLKFIISFIPLKRLDQKKLEPKFTYYSFDSLMEKGQLKKESEKDIEPRDFFKTLSPDDEASIIYTSGTTGKPKGAVFTQKNFIVVLQNIKSFLSQSLDQSDRSLSFLPLSHVLGRIDSLLPLVLNHELVFARDINKLKEDIFLSKPTFIIAVPRVFEKIYEGIINKANRKNAATQKVFKLASESCNNYFEKLDNDKSPTTSEILKRKLAYFGVFEKVYKELGGKIRFLVSGGAPLSGKVQDLMRYSNLPILEGYGLTETLGPITLNPLTKQIKESVGLPMGDVKVQFANDGEILIKSDCLFKMYLDDPIETNKSFNKDGWFKSGDIGKLEINGHIKITGRKKDIIITSGGKNISPQKIEELMKRQTLINQFIVVGDKRKFISGIVIISKDDLADFIVKQQLDPNIEIKNLSKNKALNEAINAEINDANQNLAKYQTIKKFLIAPFQLTIENSLLTPSLKVRKHLVIKKLETEINKLYVDL